MQIAEVSIGHTCKTEGRQDAYNTTDRVEGRRNYLTLKDDTDMLPGQR